MVAPQIWGGGTLVLNNTSAIGTAGNVLTAANGAIASGTPGGLTLVNPVVLNGQGVVLSYNLPGAAVTFTGSNPLTLSGIISGAGGLTVNAASTLTFAGSASNTYTGMTTVNAGLLQFSKTAGNSIAGPLAINGGTAQETTNVNQLNTQPLLMSATNTVETLTFNGTITGGTFSLTFNGQTTNAITYSTATATLQTAIQTALNTLATVGNNNTLVNVSGNVATISFQGGLAGAAQSQLTPNSSLGGTGAGITPATTVLGSTGTLALGTNPGTVALHRVL